VQRIDRSTFPKRLRHHFRQNLVAYLALFVALGGTSYAGVQALSKNSVGAREIKPGAVRASEVKNNSLGLRDLSGRAERSLRARGGPPGPPGPVGPQGPAGPQGSAAASIVQGSTNKQLVNGATSEDVFPPSGFTRDFGPGGPPNPPPLGPIHSVQVTPNVPIVVSDLHGKLRAAPGGSAVRFIRLVAFNPARVVLSCAVAGAATTCNSGSQSATLAPGTEYRISIFSGAVGPAPSEGAAWAFRATTP
jgi:hypothetical protein